MLEIQEKESHTFSSIKTYNDFFEVLGIEAREYLFTPAEGGMEVIPTPLLVEYLRRMQGFRLGGEQSLREAFIFPVLSEVFLNFRERITLFSDVVLKIEGEERNLNGFCDYLIGGTPGQIKPTAPLICVVEAKKEDFEIGTWQCAAELYVCKLNNERAGRPYPFYIGVVTIGRMWLFIKLDCEKKLLIRDTYYYSIDNLPRLLGVWKWALDSLLSAAPAA